MGERKTFSYIQELKTLTIKEHVLKEWVKDVFQQKKEKKIRSKEWGTRSNGKQSKTKNQELVKSKYLLQNIMLIKIWN